MGGIEKADQIGARWAMRQVLALREVGIANVILGTADDTFDPAKLRTDVQTARQALRLYPGRTVLAAASYTLNAMVQNIAATAVIGDAFARIVTGSNAAEAALGLSFDAWKRGLALFLAPDAAGYAIGTNDQLRLVNLSTNAAGFNLYVGGSL
jgi:hypothetical protein